MGPGRLVFALAFAAYAWTAAPAAGWLDSAEFVAASASLGVAHPPGHPIPAIFGKTIMLVPIGDAYFRANLAAAIAGALAALALWAAAREAIRALGAALDDKTRDVVAAGAALGFAFTWAAWSQSVRAEVYAIEAALAFATLAGVLRFARDGDRGALAGAALAAGLALANHHYITLSFAVPAAAVALARRPGWRAGARAAALGALGLAALLYIPARAARDPLVNWGDATTAERLLWTVSGAAFQKSLGEEHAGDSFGTELIEIARATTEETSAGAVALAAAGLVLLARRRGARGAAVLLAGVVAAGAVGRAALGFDRDNPDAHGYLLPALGAVLILAAGGVAGAVDALPAGAARRGGALVGAIAAAALPPIQAARFVDQASLRQSYSAEVMGRSVLDDLPNGALLISAYHETLFAAWALRAVEQARPDVTLLDRNYLTHPFAPAQARRRDPELAPLIDAPLRGGLPTPVAALAAQAARRPVAFELSFNLAPDDPALPSLVPHGPIAWFRPGGEIDREEAERLDAAALDRWERALRATPEPGDDVDRIVLYEAFMSARAYCALGRGAAGTRALDRARAVAPNDPDVERLARCFPERSP